jgi:hypothetical protein
MAVWEIYISFKPVRCLKSKTTATYHFQQSCVLNATLKTCQRDWTRQKKQFFQLQEVHLQTISEVPFTNCQIGLVYGF